jgi:endonuclease/exonuclease/phosphatase family metal-dependent hydrolase
MLVLALGCNEQAPVAPDGDDIFVEKSGNGTDPLKVMTWNIYVGTNVDIILGASDPSQVPVLAAEAFQLLLSTDFPARAEAIVDQIEETSPHLIGLQEISLLRIQSPGGLVMGGTTPAETVVLDYLQILMNALQARGLEYKVAGMIQNTDAEVPMITGQDPLTFDDVRLTDFDVILARQDVDISNVLVANYDAKLTVPGLGIEVLRGFVAVDAIVQKQTYRFVNTHLEPFSSGEAIQLAQAQELLAAVAGEINPVILTGDLNTRPPDAETYALLQSEGLIDSWTINEQANRSNPDGYTSNHDDDLRNDVVDLHERIDFIMVKEAEKEVRVKASVIGDELHDRTSSDLWPSDHAGIIAKLRFKGYKD